MIGRTIIVAAILTLVAATSACHRAARTAPQGVVQDSVRGVVSITGTAFEQSIVLRATNNIIALAANAADSAALTRLGGVDVLVFGTPEAKRFRVSAFRAMSVAGSPVVDGVVRAESGRLVLETSSGRVTLGNPPAPLRNMVGARVWIGGALDTGPNTYGLIAPAR